MDSRWQLLAVTISGQSYIRVRRILMHLSAYIATKCINYLAAVPI